MRMISDHLNVCVHINKIYEEHDVFLDPSCAGFRSTIACIGYFCYFNLTFLILLIVDVSWTINWSKQRSL